MPIRQDENQPNRRFGIINLVLIGFGALLLFSSFFPSQNTQVPRVPYSLFINQVDDGEVKRAYSCHDEPLGTLDDGFELFKAPMPCITPTCVSSADSKIPKERTISNKHGL